MEKVKVNVKERKEYVSPSAIDFLVVPPTIMVNSPGVGGGEGTGERDLFSRDLFR